MMAAMITLILIGLLRGLRTRRALVLENLALRHQLAVLQRSAPRLRLRRSDRLFWVLLSRLWSGWAGGGSIRPPPTLLRLQPARSPPLPPLWSVWSDRLPILQPAPVIRWQRSGFKLFWTWKSRRNGPGRPPVAPEGRTLIRRVSKGNLLGAGGGG